MLDVLSSRVVDVIHRLEEKAKPLSKRSQAGKTLRQVALIQSTESSNRIEGVTVAKLRVE